MSALTMVSVKLGAAQLDALNALAAEHGGSRSAAIRALIDGAQAGGPPGRLDRDGVLAVLEQHARAGSVPATRELLLHLETEGEVERLNAIARGGE
jgi:hypothetical protein